MTSLPVCLINIFHYIFTVGLLVKPVDGGTGLRGGGFLVQALVRCAGGVPGHLQSAAEDP